MTPRMVRNCAFAVWLSLLAAPALAVGGAPSPAEAVLKALAAPDATPERRQEAWQRLTESGQPIPKSVVEAVDKARQRGWRDLGALVQSPAARKAAAGLRARLAPLQGPARDAIRGGGFSRAKLDQAMEPIEKALEEARAPLRESDRHKALRSVVHEMEGYAAGCGLRIGWSEELGDILGSQLFVCRYAGSPAWQQTLESNRRLGAWIDPQEHACMARLNLHRMLIGIAPAAIDLRLVIAAKKHSEEMVAKRYFSHESPTAGLQSFGQRASREYTGASGECIAGSGSGLGAFGMWYYSQGHHTIMIAGSSVGVGRCNDTCTLMSGNSRMVGEAANKMAQYVRRRYEAGEEAAKLLDLAKWCAEARLLTQAQDELERVVLLDPKNDAAKRALDRIRTRER